jgi:hypothetical protein
VSKKEYTDRKLTSDFEALMSTRNLYSAKTGDPVFIVDGASANVRYAMPIVTEGDVVGCIACLSGNSDSLVDEGAEAKLIQTAASFLGKQFEG